MQFNILQAIIMTSRTITSLDFKAEKEIRRAINIRFKLKTE